MRLKPYAPVFAHPVGGIVDERTHRFYARPEYDNIELASLARWLNEREAGYPTVPFLRAHDEARLEAVTD